MSGQAEAEENIHPTSTQYSRNGDNRITLSGFTEEEIHEFEGSLATATWVRFKAGRLESSPAYVVPLAPEDDPYLGQVWQKQLAFDEPELRFKEFSPVSAFDGPGIIIQHLCGYDYSEEGYKSNAHRLMEYRFACCRSQRGADGKYWEVWLLPGLWMAAGGLKQAFDGEIECRDCGVVTVTPQELCGTERCPSCLSEKLGPAKAAKDDRERTKRAISFLCRNVRFGCLDVTVQRAAMVLD